VDFTFSDGGTYYLVLECKDPCAGPEDVRPSIRTAAAAVGMWNQWMLTQPSGTAGDLTKVDPETFRKLPPFFARQTVNCAQRPKRPSAKYLDAQN